MMWLFPHILKDHIGEYVGNMGIVFGNMICPMKMIILDHFCGEHPISRKENIWVLQVEGDSLVIIFTTDQYIDLGLFKVIHVCF